MSMTSCVWLTVQREEKSEFEWVSTIWKKWLTNPVRVSKWTLEIQTPRFEPFFAFSGDFLKWLIFGVQKVSGVTNQVVQKFFDPSIFDPQRSSGQNQWSKAYSRIVSVLVQQHVLSIANFSVTPFRLKIFSDFFPPFFSSFTRLLLNCHIIAHYITTLHHYTDTTVLHGVVYITS